MQLPFDDHIRRRIYLVRHGHAVGSDEGSARYSNEISLTPRGVAEAEAMREALREAPLDEAWSSDISRSRETAAIILQQHALPHGVSSAYREIDAGDLGSAIRKGHGDARQRMRAIAYEFWRASEAEARLFNCGEVYADYFARATAAIESLALNASGRHVLLVAHSVFNRAALCWAVGAGAGSMAAFEQDTCCLNILDIDLDPQTGQIARRHLRLVNYSPLDPVKRELLLTDSEASATHFMALLAKFESH